MTNRKKKAAFTLAEVLITLGIIGIIAAMTLPMLIADYKKKEIPIRLMKYYSTMQNAINAATVDHGPVEYWDFPTEQTSFDQMVDFVNKYLFPYLKGIKECSTTQSSTFCRELRKTLNEGKGTGYLPVYIFSDGSCFTMTSGGITPGVGGNIHFTFDYNCLGKPNKFDQDIFTFYLHFKNGKSATFYTGNYVTTNLKTREELLESCKNHYVDTHHHGTCSTLIQYDGWQIKDDYPWL